MERPQYFVPKAGAKGMTQLMDDCCWGNLAGVKRELRSGADVNVKDESGFTALSWLLRVGNRDEYRRRRRIFRLLLDHGASLDATDTRGKNIIAQARQTATGPLRNLVEREFQRLRKAARGRQSDA